VNVPFRVSKRVFLFLLMFLGFTVFAYQGQIIDNRDQGQMMTHPKRVFLMGASVGKEWNLPEFPKRKNIDNIIFESAAIYQFDKSEALKELLIRPKRKFHLTRTYLKGFFKQAPQLPDMIIIKECAAYFPGDTKKYQIWIEEWVKGIKEAKIEVMLATVVPVTKERAEKEPTKMESIRDYNDWIRRYAQKENLKLLDLETALRTDPSSRFLKDDLTEGDGLHLNGKAYAILDDFLVTTLKLK
jgi:hypothetical protein